MEKSLACCHRWNNKKKMNKSRPPRGYRWGPTRISIPSSRFVMIHSSINQINTSTWRSLATAFVACQSNSFAQVNNKEVSNNQAGGIAYFLSSNIFVQEVEYIPMSDSLPYDSSGNDGGSAYLLWSKHHAGTRIIISNLCKRRSISPFAHASFATWVGARQTTSQWSCPPCRPVGSVLSHSRLHSIVVSRSLMISPPSSRLSDLIKESGFNSSVFSRWKQPGIKRLLSPHAAIDRLAHKLFLLSPSEIRLVWKWNPCVLHCRGLYRYRW